MELLKEFTVFDYIKEDIREEKTSGGKPKLILKGILQRADTLNQNGRIYPRVVLERELINYQKLIKERRAFGALDHTDSSIVELKTVSHIVTEARMENNIVYGKVEILPTPYGDILRSLVESNTTIGISSRGVGSTEMDNDGYQVVQDDFQLICLDIVNEPSTPGAWLMKEGKRILTSEEIKNLKHSYFKQSDRIDRVINDILKWK